MEAAMAECSGGEEMAAGRARNPKPSKGMGKEKANLAREVKKEREAKEEREESVPLLMNSWRRLMLRLLVTGALSRRWDGWTVMETWLKKFMMLTWPLLTKTSLTGLMNKKLRIAPTKLLK